MKQEKTDLYGAIDELLSKCQSDHSPAELHGLVCGLISGGKRDKESVLREILPSDSENFDNPQMQWVGFFIDAAVDALSDTQFSFQPLLPSEHLPLAERIAALSDWCRGVVYGLGLAELSSQQLGRENQELISDLVAISQASIDTSENTSDESEAEEESLTEIIEYARMGVMGLFLDYSQTGNKTEEKAGNKDE